MEFFGVNLVDLVRTGGYVVLFTIVFAESGVFFGFFLPGGSMLFVAGFLASQGTLDIVALVALTFVAAVLGDMFGYIFGYKVGPSLFRREESPLFKKSHLLKARAFYDRHGRRALIIARFMPVVRTFAPIVAGAVKISFRSFMVYNVSGAFLWIFLMVNLGYWLGSSLPDVDRYVTPIVVTIVFLSVLPGILQYVRTKGVRHKIA
jgi:membrane-associated protein